MKKINRVMSFLMAGALAATPVFSAEGLTVQAKDEHLETALTDLMVMDEGRQGLIDAISEFEAKEESSYAEKSWDEYATLVDEAKEMLYNPVATVDEMNILAEEIKKAESELVELTELVEALLNLKDYGEVNYIEDSYDKFVEVVVAAMEVLEEPAATWEEVAAATASLNATAIEINLDDIDI